MFFAGSLFEVYFYNLGMSLPEIFFADSLWFVAGILLLPLFKGFRTRPFILAGIGISFLSVVLLLVYPEPSAAYLYRLLLGSTMFFFWTPFNTAFYEFRKENNAMLGAVYYSIGPVLSLGLPAVSGIIAVTLGFPLLFSLAMATYALSFIAGLFMLQDRKYKYDIPKSLKSLKGLRKLIFLEGFSTSAITSVTLPVMLLLYTDKPIEFGWFLSLVTVFSIAASFFVSRLSDTLQKRSIFLLPSSVGFALSAVLASQAQDILFFFIGFGMINFFSRLFSPISLALAVDNAKNIAHTMAGREFLLNVGRISSCIIGLAIMMTFGAAAALLVQGLAMLLFVPVFELDKDKLLRS